MSYSKQKSHITRSKILSPTDTESIETMLDSIESRLDDDIFKDIMNILQIQPEYIQYYSQINYNEIKTKTPVKCTNTVFQQVKSNKNNVNIDVDIPILNNAFNIGVDVDTKIEDDSGPTLATLNMLQTFYNSSSL